MQKDAKKQVIKKYQTHGKDTGSAQVQVAILTEKIAHLTEHLKTHHKDDHSRRGLIKMVGRRTKLLRYLKLRSYSEYASVIKNLGLRK